MYLIREPVVVVGGHVDHGKTTLLDYIRGTTVVDKEAGKITQHIGATEVPVKTISQLCGNLLQKYNIKLTIPGLLFIDTPGHEAFCALRERGCEMADFAILVVDIMQGCQPQTIEMMKHLKEDKVPFVVALTKIDSIKGYNKQLNLTEVLAEVDEAKTQYAQYFSDKFYKLVGQLGEQGFSSDRFDKVKEFTKELLLIPVSSKDGKGVAELLLFISGLAQKYLETNLTVDVKGLGKATVLEVKDEKGFGRTLDVILYDGMISVNDYIKIESKNGTFVTKIKMLLRPKPMQDMRTTKEKFTHEEKVYAAAGIKIIANDVDNVSAGDAIYVVSGDDAKSLETMIKKINKTAERGIIAKVDVEGSAEALIELAKKNDVEIYKVEVGSITKEDIVEAKLFKDHNPKYGAIFAFNSAVSDDVSEYGRKQGVKIFSFAVIYKIFEEYAKWIKNEEEATKAKILSAIVYPVEFKIIPEYIFHQSKPFVCGIEVLDGLLKPDIKLIQDNKIIGTLKRIQDNGKDIKEAKKGMQVAVSIEGTSFDKVDLSKNFYAMIPFEHRKYVKQYLESEFKELINRLDDIYSKMNN